MTTTIEDRLANIERELAQLKMAVGGGGTVPKAGWLSRLTGSHKDDPVFDEIIRLGKEMRDAEEIEYKD